MLQRLSLVLLTLSLLGVASAIAGAQDGQSPRAKVAQSDQIAPAASQGIGRRRVSSSEFCVSRLKSRVRFGVSGSGRGKCVSE